MKIFKFLIVTVLVFGVLYFSKDKLLKKVFGPRESNTPTGTLENKTQPSQEGEQKAIEEIATGLNIPWEIVFLPTGDMLVTERGGKLLKVSASASKTIAEIAGVKHIGEGGLLGLALDPNFTTNKFIYLYSTTSETGGVTNRVERYKLENDTLSQRVVILANIKGSSNHDGGRIAFGPDGYLYIATGDAETPNLAQDTNSLSGKILRIKSDGSIPEDNPFKNEVYSYGHRNPQGLAWDKNGNLWITEHGPSGSQTGNDEVNKIIKGGNYGWPEIRGQETKEGMITPIVESGKSDTWAPAGSAYIKDKLFFTGLRGEALYELSIEADEKPILLTNFKAQFGRLRVVVIGPDGHLYIATSNKDGRGRPKNGDDKIIRIRI